MLMELIRLKRSAMLVPTPGQTEQEYLGKYLSEKGWFKTVLQKSLDCSTEIPFLKANWPDNLINESNKLLDDALKEL
jgi:hypothetical protein